MNILQILYQIKLILNSIKQSTSKEELVQYILRLEKFNSAFYDMDNSLYEKIQVYINNLDIEYAYSLDASKDLNWVAINKTLVMFSEFITQKADSMGLDTSKQHVLGGYDIAESLDYFREQAKNQTVSDNEIIKEGVDGFGLSGFELDKYFKFIRENIL